MRREAKDTLAQIGLEAVHHGNHDLSAATPIITPAAVNRVVTEMKASFRRARR